MSLNTLDLDLMDGSWQGRYYTDYPVTLIAQETDGAAFDHWEIEGGSIIEGSQDSASIQVQLEEGRLYRELTPFRSSDSFLNSAPSRSSDAFEGQRFSAVLLFSVFFLPF